MNKVNEGQEEDPAGEFIPAMVRKRMHIINDIRGDLDRRRFRSLDETDPDDLKKVIDIIQDKRPETNYWKAREYARVCIRQWNKRRRK